MRHCVRSALVAAAAALSWWSSETLAHGFAVRYDLPLPLGFYLAGAGATVALSFLILALFAAKTPARSDGSPSQIVLPAAGRFLSNPWIRGALQAISVALFLLVLAAALFGDINPYRNISTTFIWVIWWVGLLFVNMFVGDVWALVNPWNAIFAWAERMLNAVRPGAKLSFGWAYPERWGVWPALILFLAFAWLELISGEGEDPRSMATAVIAYSLITWSGMLAFGRQIWLARGEAFAVVFSTFARFAPLAYRTGGVKGPRCPHGVETNGNATTGCAACFDTAPVAARALALRAPGTGLLVQQPVPPSLAALVLTLLATVTFDGFFATPAWTAIHDCFVALPGQAPRSGIALNFYLVATVVFLLFPLAFAAAFLFCSRLTARLGGAVTTAAVAGSFVLTLLPIAIAYHFAHYIVYLLLSGQYIIPAISDPFGYGWDLFGTASFKPDIGLVGARFAWYTAVIAIVTGHVIAVWLAHRTAQRLFGERRRMLASGLPMLALMVCYTMTSLWIIAQPAVQ
jgi:hypothetical protein